MLVVTVAFVSMSMITKDSFAFDVFDPVFSFKVLESYMDLAGLDYTWNYRGMLVMHC